ATAASSWAIIRSSSTAPSPLRRRRNASIVLRRATAMSHASALSGTPRAGQSTSAAANASDKASSAPATSPVRAARTATSLPALRRATASAVSRAPCANAIAAPDLHRPDRTDLDGAMAGAGASRRPGNGSVEIGHVDHVVSAELLLGLGVRSIEHLGLAVGDAHGARRRGWPQALAADDDARVGHGFRIGAEGGVHLGGFGLVPALHVRFVGIDQQQVLHGGFLKLLRTGLMLRRHNDVRASPNSTATRKKGARSPMPPEGPDKDILKFRI